MTHEELVNIADEYESKSNWPAAIKIYRQLYDQSPTINVISKLAWNYSRNNDFDAAKEQCALLVEKEPNNAKWWYMYGYQFYMEKNWSAAIEYFEKSLECNPDYFVVLYRVSYSYLQVAGEFLKLTKSEYWKAIGYLKKAHLIWKYLPEDKKEIERKTYYLINFLHGKALMLIPNHNSIAIELFKQALNLKDDFNCRYNLSKSLFYDEQYELAKEVLPNEKKYYITELEANIEYKLGNVEKALNIALRLLQKKPKDYLYYFVANIELERGNFAEAYQYAQKAISANNRNHKNYYILALVYYKSGLLSKALEALKKAELLKVEKYKSNYQECEDLRNQINAVITEDYVDDPQLIASLEGNLCTYTASVTQYNEERGFGFAYIDGQRVFVHISNFKYGKPYKGAKIQFKLESTSKGKQAKDITVVN